MSGTQKRRGRFTDTKVQNSKTQVSEGVKNEIKDKKAGPQQSQEKGRGWWHIVKGFNVILGILCMVAVSYTHSLFMFQLHENNMWFTNIKEVEREISFRTESGLYYSYFKQMMHAPSLSQGLTDLTQDKLTEHPDTINILERMNVYQEVILAAIYRLCGCSMPPILFYIYSIFALHGMLVASLYLLTWMLSGSWLAGLLAASFYIFNRMDTTRVEYSIPLRESFSLPFIWMQAAALTVYFQSKIFTALQRLILLCILLSTFLFCLFWQFNQFIMMLQSFSLFGVWVLNIVPPWKIRNVILCQQLSLFAVCILQFGNKMLLGSMAVSFNFIFLAFIMLINNDYKCRSLAANVVKVVAVSILCLLLALVLNHGIKIILNVDSDEHIVKFLQNKFGVGNERDFDSQLYLCLGIFGFITSDVFIRMTEHLVFPFYIPAHVGMLGYLVYTVVRKWRLPQSKESENNKQHLETNAASASDRPDLMFHTVQAVFFCALAVITLRMKYLWTPYVCVLAATGVSERALWKRVFRMKDELKVTLVQNAVVVLILGVLIGKLLPQVLKELEVLTEFWDPDTVELMEWIMKNTPVNASFTGSMQLLAGVKLCTGRPITNHPHYEDKNLRHKTKQLYQIYGRRQPNEVHSILKHYKSDFIILEDSICRAPSMGGCRTPDIVDIDNGIKPDEEVGIKGLVPSNVPRFCENVRDQKPSYRKFFKSVLINKTFRVYKVL